MPEANYLAVVIAALVAFLLGAIWYSPVGFSKTWVADGNFDVVAMKAKMTPPRMAWSYGLAIVASLIGAWLLDVLLIGPPHHGNVLSGAERGFAAGFGWVALSFASNYA
ncbi:MAG TPA: DUF1761 domain-containing protein, partial [Gemmatimonadales bacterium]|nr:DUF1761 domain-containing protein [Gemmatimonadales bacterium]